MPRRTPLPDSKDTRLRVLHALADYVWSTPGGWFPNEVDFCERHYELIQSYLALKDDERLLWVWENTQDVIWTVESLRMLVRTKPLAIDELRTTVNVIEAIRSRRGGVRREHSVQDLITALKHENPFIEVPQVQRAVLLLSKLRGTKEFNSSGSPVRPESVLPTIELLGLETDDFLKPLELPPLASEAEPVARAPIQKEAPARWVVVGRLGRGGQGIVNHVRRAEPPFDEGAQKTVRRGDDEQAIARLVHERQSLEKLRHPCIVRLADSLEDDETISMVMEYVPLGALKDSLAVLRGDVHRGLRIARDIANALAYAHANGVVHRDVKPQNVLLRSIDHALLADFGIAHDPDQTGLTGTAEPVGSRWFGAPEGRRGRIEPTPQFDTFSLGKVLYTTLLGGERFEGDVMGEATVSARLGRPDLQPLDDLINDMIALAPDKRPSMSTVIERLDATQPAMGDSYRKPDPDGGQRCQFCGLGSYRVCPTNPFMPSTGLLQVVCYACDRCNHLLSFFAEQATLQRVRADAKNIESPALTAYRSEALFARPVPKRRR